MSVDANAPLLRALVEAASVPLLVLDGEGRIVDVNASAAAFFGGQSEPLRGKPFVSLVALADRRRVRHALLTLEHEPMQSFDVAVGSRREPTVARLELHRVGDGIALAVRPHDDDDDHRVSIAFTRLPIGLVAIGRDGTVRSVNAAARRVEPTLGAGRPFPGGSPLATYLRRLLDHGGALPARLVPLEDGRTLRVAGSGIQDDAPAVLVVDDVTSVVEQTEAQREFVRNAAHQLRTPLAGIASAIEVLQAGAKEDPAERDRFLDHVARETERLSRLARALLVLARAQSGTQAPQLEFVAVAPLLERIAREVHHLPSVVVEAYAPPELAAFVEPDLLDEALRALAENAARHTREGFVTMSAFRSGERHLEIEVADTGDGILPEHLDRVFDPFFRATPDGVGFGLGLAIARRAVTAMGGELSVQSEPRVGTRFAVRVPSADILAT